MKCFFVSDLHGHKNRYETLFTFVASEKPACVLFGGDMLPLKDPGGFLHTFLFPLLRNTRQELKSIYPEIFIIPGNDDPAVFDEEFRLAEKEGLLQFIPEKTVLTGSLTITGYPYVPPTPFQLKDREKFDVSRFVDPGCLPPDAGRRTLAPDYDTEFSFISKDLQKLSAGLDPRSSIFLFHSPPYKSGLDRAALDGQSFDHVPLDVHVGSIAIQRFIEDFQPMLTLHGHIHESYRITGIWKELSGQTVSLSAADEVPKLAIVRFSTGKPGDAERTEYVLS
jgi:Icc-related predicted phosphoesterase